MNGLLVAWRKHTDIDITESIGMCEFIVVPPSLFCSDGSFFKEQEKSVIAEALKELQNEQEEPHSKAINSMEYHSDYKRFMIIDCIAFVIKLTSKLPKRTFVSILQNVSSMSSTIKQKNILIGANYLS